STSQYPTGKSLFASTSIYPTQPYDGGIGLNYFEHAACRGTAGDFAGSSASVAQTGAVPGAHSVLATFSAPQGTAGEFRITLLANAGVNGTAFATVDLDNDGTVEYARGTTGSVAIPYTIGASGQVVVRINNECQMPGVGVATYNRGYSEISVWFMPDQTATCNITSYGQGCGGVQAAGTEIVAGTTRNLTVLATGCFPSSPVIVATGSQQVSLPLLGGCTLLCNAEGVAIAAADATGNATKMWSIPTTVTGTTYIQMLPIALQGGALVLTASNGVQIHCF
ncbi:MAG: hypothetical protein KDC98_26105, partial [Planctomycetes bacterium]|nr:hypothetical protein [Planctomycetota bacterium]